MAWFRRSGPLDELVTESSFLALDLETTGLDPSTDHIASVGWVPIDHAEVVLAGAGEALVRPPVSIGDSATIHGLTDSDLESAPPLAEVLPEVLSVLADRVLVCHHAPLEIGFLSRAHPGFSTTYVDTLALELRLHPKQEMQPGSLRLGASRRRHGLPTYGAHSALSDALAAAELLLAQAAELTHRLGRPVTLRDLGARRRR